MLEPSRRLGLAGTIPEACWQGVFEDLGVSINGGTPKSSIFIAFSFINHPFWGRKPPFLGLRWSQHLCQPMTFSRAWPGRGMSWPSPRNPRARDDGPWLRQLDAGASELLHALDVFVCFRVPGCMHPRFLCFFLQGILITMTLWPQEIAANWGL